jgi:hypothetical protein
MTFSQELDRLSLHFVKITLQIRKGSKDRFACDRVDFVVDSPPSS